MNEHANIKKIEQVVAFLLQSDYEKIEWEYDDSLITEYTDDNLRIVFEDMYGFVLVSIDKNTEYKRKVNRFPIHFEIPITSAELSLIQQLVKTKDLLAYDGFLPGYPQYDVSVLERFHDWHN
jgi:hypothetical protein